MDRNKQSARYDASRYPFSEVQVFRNMDIRETKEGRALSVAIPRCSILCLWTKTPNHSISKSPYLPSICDPCSRKGPAEKIPGGGRNWNRHLLSPPSPFTGMFFLFKIQTRGFSKFREGCRRSIHLTDLSRVAGRSPIIG